MTYRSLLLTVALLLSPTLLLLAARHAARRFGASRYSAPDSSAPDSSAPDNAASGNSASGEPIQWSWEAMRGSAPAPKPRWRHGVFLHTARRREVALCVNVTAEASLSECHAALSGLRAGALTWTEPELFCIEAQLPAPDVSFAYGVTRLRLRLRDAEGHNGTRTEVLAVFEPSSSPARTVRESDALHAAFDTPLMRQYTELGISAEQMRSIEVRYRAAACWAVALLGAFALDEFASELEGANLVRVVSRRL